MNLVMLGSPEREPNVFAVVFMPLGLCFSKCAKNSVRYPGIPHPPRDSHFPTVATTNFRLHFKCLDNPSYGYILNWLDRK
jgi:hypothetical protein